MTLQYSFASLYLLKISLKSSSMPFVKENQLQKIAFTCLLYLSSIKLDICVFNEDEQFLHL